MIILCALTDQTSRELAAEAARSTAAELVVVQESAGPESAFDWVGLICDLRGDPQEFEPLNAVRRVRPGLPVLLYVHPSADHVEQLAEVVRRFPDVTVQPQRAPERDLRLFRDFIRACIKTAPESRVLDVFLTAQPTLPGWIRPLAGRALGTLLHDGRPSVAMLAKAAGLSTRQLERRWPAPPFPRPKRFLLWIEALLIVMLVRTERRAVNEAARRLGHNERSVARLRNELGLPPLGQMEPLKAFAAVREELIKECSGESPEQARDMASGSGAA